jgi:hypothetical protein
VSGGRCLERWARASSKRPATSGQSACNSLELAVWQHRSMSRDATITRYGDLAARILESPSERSRLVAVDGPGGTGKSFFAQRLAGALGNAPIVHTDDFATGEPGVEWWPRLDREVLQPLVIGQTGRYQRYDWDRRALMEWHDVPAAPVVIIDGVSSARREIAPHLALAVWVHAPRAVRLARGLERDGEDARGDWERWMAEEDSHFRSDDTIARCQVFVNGAPTRPHNSRREFVEFDLPLRVDESTPSLPPPRPADKRQTFFSGRPPPRNRRMRVSGAGVARGRSGRGG